MAAASTLLPFLPSDDEDIVDKEENLAGSSSEEEEDDHGDMQEGFQFGGILGEDGSSFLSTLNNGGTNEYSFQQILQKLEEQSETSAVARANPRMDIASLIAAKRQTLELESKKKLHDREEVHKEDTTEANENPLVINGKQSGKLEDDVIKTRSGRHEAKDELEPGPTDSESSDDEDKDEANKAALFFDLPMHTTGNADVFSQLTLSRPLLRGVAAMGFVQPTPIQAAVIPVALSGRDICASAVTGSGKSAAFLLPVLERLLHRQSSSRSAIKAVILAPTRELAAQGMAFALSLGQFTKLKPCLITGGSKNSTAQQVELRSRPDIVIATPGRLLDHVMNSPGVSLDAVELLVLDEADRLLDLGFQEEVHELIRHCPKERQTMLFSATMNTKVDDLVKLSLKRPIRIRISASSANSTAKSDKRMTTKDLEVAPRLEQEFIRIRSSNEGMNREGILLALLTRTFTRQTIVFFDTKAEAHRMMIICGLTGIQCTELHGNLTQQQRLQALEEFKHDNVNVLLASDLACRGLDIDSVKTVINFEMPNNLETYIHRIGRTARAGRGGKSCTLIGESRRHLMKELIRNAEKQTILHGGLGKNDDGIASFETGVIRSRTIPSAVIGHFVDKIRGLEPHIDEVLQAETVAKMDRLAEMEAVRAQNLIEHSDEILARPRREWFASQREKDRTKLSAAERHKMYEESCGTGIHRMSRKKRRAQEAKQELNDSESMSKMESDGGDDEATPIRKQTPKVNIKADARRQKKAEAAMTHMSSEKSINEIDVKTKARMAKKRRTSHASGDGSLFDEEKTTYSSGSNSKVKKHTSPESFVAKSSFHFRGFDPSKKLGTKRGNKAFKSKNKYKRKK